MVKPPTLKTDTQQLSLPQSQQTAFADYDQTSLVYPSIGPSGFWADPAMKPPQPALTRNLSSSSASLLSKMKSVGFIGHSKTNMPALIPALIGLPTPIQRPENSLKKVGTPTVQEDDDGVIGTKNLGGEILKDEERKSFGHFSFSSGIWNAPGSNGRLVRNNSTGSSAVIGSNGVLENGIPTTTRLFEQGSGTWDPMMNGAPGSMGMYHPGYLPPPPTPLGISIGSTGVAGSGSLPPTSTMSASPNWNGRGFYQ